MLDAANNGPALTDPDDIEEMRIEADRATIRQDAKQYVGIPNLLDLATATSLEHRRECAELSAAAKKRSFKSQTDRDAAKHQWRAILVRIRLLERDLLAMTTAMDEATLAKFDEAIEAMPAPSELIAHG